MCISHVLTQQGRPYPAPHCAEVGYASYVTQERRQLSLLALFGQHFATSPGLHQPLPVYSLRYFFYGRLHILGSNPPSLRPFWASKRFAATSAPLIRLGSAQSMASRSCRRAYPAWRIETNGLSVMKPVILTTRGYSNAEKRCPSAF